MPTILAAIDFSDVSPRVIEAAAAASRGAEDRIVLLHVAPPDPDYVTYRVGPEDEREEIARRLREVRDRLQSEREQLAARGVTAEALVVQGDAADRINEEATRRDAGLVVIGHHRHGRLHDRLVGSVTEAVLRAAPCPVLVVPLGGH